MKRIKQDFFKKVAEWKFDQLDTDRDGVLKKKELKVTKAVKNDSFTFKLYFYYH